jgi:hypothetical protein
MTRKKTPYIPSLTHQKSWFIVIHLYYNNFVCGAGTEPRALCILCTLSSTELLQATIIHLGIKVILKSIWIYTLH